MNYSCPICRTALEPIPRYPRYVCDSCANKAVASDGKRLEFFSLGLSGGYEAKYVDTGVAYDSHKCFIDGFPCHADEAYFGGIVIELLDSPPDWSQFNDKQLLQAYCSLMVTLKDRGVIRSLNNPVADYTESLVSRALGLTLERQSQAGHDARDANGNRYQIKGRRLEAHNKPAQLGALRNLDHRPFDILAAVIFDENLTVLYGALIPIDVVVELSRFSKHTNSHILVFRRNTLEDPRVTDITAALSSH